MWFVLVCVLHFSILSSVAYQGYTISCALDKAGYQRALIRELVIRRLTNCSEADVLSMLNDTDHYMNDKFFNINTPASVALQHLVSTGDGVWNATEQADVVVKQLSAQGITCWYVIGIMQLCVLMHVWLTSQFYKRLLLTSELMRQSPVPLLVIENKQLVFVNNAFQSLYNLKWERGDTCLTYTKKLTDALPILYRDAGELAGHADIIWGNVPTRAPYDMWLTPIGSDARIRIQLCNNYCNGVVWCTILDINAAHERILTQRENDKMSSKMQLQTHYEKLCRAADNHILHNCKNIFIGVRDMLMVQPEIQNVKEIVTSLQSGVSICHDREFFNLIEQREYRVKTETVNIGVLLANTAAINSIDLHTPTVFGFFHLDTKVFDVVMRDAITNAKLYSEGTSLPTLTAKIDDEHNILIQIENTVGKAVHGHSSNIGLRNMMKCVEAVGWCVSLDVGTRAHFCLKIPIYSRPGVPTETHLKCSKEDARVMALDDSGLMRLSTALTVVNFLQCQDNEGERVFVRGQTQQEIEGFADLVSKVAPAVVLLDFNLESSLNGYDVLLQIRKNKYAGPVVLRSANNGAEDVEEYMQMGFTECVGKEISLVTVLGRYIQ